MKKVAIKNRVMFFGGTAIVGVIAIFIFSMVLVGGIFGAAPKAHAYAVGDSTSTGGITPSSATIEGYDFGTSLQNLISPFTNFFTNLKLNGGTSVNIAGQTSGFPVVNFTPVVESGIQSIVSQWLSEFNNWFYGISGVQLSGIFYVLLNAIAWTLGLAQQVVNWLLGLFH